MALMNVCPRCGSKNFTKTPDGKLLCMNCGFKGEAVMPRPTLK